MSYVLPYSSLLAFVIYLFHKCKRSVFCLYIITSIFDCLGLSFTCSTLALTYNRFCVIMFRSIIHLFSMYIIIFAEFPFFKQGVNIGQYVIINNKLRIRPFNCLYSVHILLILNVLRFYLALTLLLSIVFYFQFSSAANFGI